jgi:type II secretory pathway component GspD/PulD (secretin)
MKLKLVLPFVLGLGLSGAHQLGRSLDAPEPVLAPSNSNIVEDLQQPVASIDPPEPRLAPEAAPPAEPVPLAESAPACDGDPDVELDIQMPPAEMPEGIIASEERAPLILEQELPAAIHFLARMANINIQFDPSLMFTNTVIGPEGKPTPVIVSLRWENVSAEDALVEVLDNYGLMLVMNPKSGIGRVTRRPNLPPLVTAIVPLRYTSPSNIMDVVKVTFVDPRSKISADTRTSQLVIVTSEREMYGITNLVTQLDTPTKQILIEAHLLETARNPRSIKGIDWSGTLEAQNFTFGNGFTSGTTRTRTPGDTTSTVLPSGRTVTGSQSTSVATDLITTIGQGGLSADTARGLHPATAFLNADGVRAVLSFLNTENDTEVVATPRAVTGDNQTAVLAVTHAFPIFEITPGAANVPAGAQIKYTNLGTILKVTPRVQADNNISLKVIPEVSNIDSKDRQIINGQVNEANVYAIRKMETEVVIPSGNTLVMGGLISDRTSKVFSKVPILGDLPGIGLAFRRDAKSRNKANLLIFVTPTIVQSYDFQPATTGFLQTPVPYKPEKEISAWDAGRPYDWNKPQHRR